MSSPNESWPDEKTNHRPSLPKNIPHCLPQACLSTGWLWKTRGLAAMSHVSIAVGFHGPVTCHRVMRVSQYGPRRLEWWRRYGRLHTAGSAGERRRDCVGPRALHTRTQDGDTRVAQDRDATQRNLGEEMRAWELESSPEERSSQILGRSRQACSYHNLIFIWFCI